MPSSYTTSLRLTLPATGELSGTWGTTVNTGITELTDAAIAGYVSVAMTDADYTLTVANGATDQARRMMLNMTGTLTAARNVICPTASKLYIIKNATTGGFAITLKTSGGTGISIPNGSSMLLMCNGTNVVDAVTNFSSLTLGSPLLPASGGTGITSLGTDVATFLGTPSSANLAAAVTDETGSGALVFGTSPTLASPTITGTGTAAFGNLSYTGTLTGGTGVVALGTNQFYKDASGNVGIGTVTPNFKISVNNNASTPSASGFSANEVALQIVGKDGNNTRVLYQSYGGVNNFLNAYAYGGTLAAPSATVSGTNIFGISAGGYGATASVAGLARISINAESTFTDTSAPTYINFQTTPAGSITASDRMRLDSSGNLGIGGAPSYQLYVKGTGQDTANLTDAGNKAGSLYLQATGVGVGSGGAVLFGTTFGNSTPFAAIKGLVTDGSTNTKGDLAFSMRTAVGDTALSEKMRLDAAGNLGLGVVPSAWDSGYKAMQVGSAALFSSATGSGGYLLGNAYFGISGYKYYNAAAATRYEMVSGAHTWSTAPSGTAGNAISFTQAMTLDASGNLGIGTASPGVRLSVDSGATATNTNFNSTNASGVSVRFQNSSTSIGDLGSGATCFSGGTAGDFGLTSRAGNLVLGTGSTERARITSGGNLGVGTTDEYGRVNIQRFTGAPQSTLSIGDFAAAANDVGIYLRTTSTAGISWAGGALAFYGGGPGLTERARITSGGDLLVGMTATTGSLTNATKLVPGVVTSYNGTVSAATGSATTMFVAPTTAANTYLVTVNIVSTDGGASYTVLGLLRCGSITTAYSSIVTATNLTVSLSGTNLQVTQISGVSQTVQWSLLRLV